MKLAKLANRTLFVLSVVVTGSVAGAFVWALLFVMNLGISFVWDNVGGRFGIYFPLAACLVGGLVVGLFAKRFGPYPEDLDAVCLLYTSDEIEEAERVQGGCKPLHREGTQDGTWSLLDYGDIVVHVFQPETREYYRLEALWNDAPVIDLAEEAGLTELEYSDRIAKLLGRE